MFVCFCPGKKTTTSCSTAVGRQLDFGVNIKQLHYFIL